MTWVIVVVAMLILAAAAWAGTGRLGEMPEVVTDRPKGRIPSGPVDGDFVDRVRIPVAVNGYDRDQVDAYLSAWVVDREPLEAAFDVVRGGYDMRTVDEILDRAPAVPAGSRFGVDDPPEAAPQEPSSPEEIPPEEPAQPPARRLVEATPTDQSGIDAPDAE